MNLEDQFSSIYAGIKANVRQQLERQFNAPVDDLIVVKAARHFFFQALRQIKTEKLSLNEAQAYWRQPNESGNRPEDYLGTDLKRSEYLLQLVSDRGLDAPSILEIGCNAGRNLNHLYQAGYENLSAIEINSDAVALLRETFPAMAGKADLRVGALEDEILKFPDNSVDIVFSMAVLVHVHFDSDWVFAEIARVARRFVITIEDEVAPSNRHFIRDYHKVFEGQGLRQILVGECAHIQDMCHYTARVFEKA